MKTHITIHNKHWTLDSWHLLVFLKNLCTIFLAQEQSIKTGLEEQGLASEQFPELLVLFVFNVDLKKGVTKNHQTNTQHFFHFFCPKNHPKTTQKNHQFHRLQQLTVTTAQVQHALHRSRQELCNDALLPLLPQRRVELDDVRPGRLGLHRQLPGWRTGCRWRFFHVGSGKPEETLETYVAKGLEITRRRVFVTTSLLQMHKPPNITFDGC